MAGLRSGLFSEIFAMAFDTLRTSTQQGLRSPVGWVTVLGWLVLVLCVAAALLVLRGAGQRMEEYR